MGWLSPVVSPRRLTEAALFPSSDLDLAHDGVNPPNAYRQLSQITQGDRNLEPLDQDKMIQIAAWLSTANPLGYRLIEMLVDYTVGEGFTYKASDLVTPILDAHWQHWVNNWPLKQIARFREIYRFGEAAWAIFLKHDGAVTLGYIDPANIQRVRANPYNVEILEWLDQKRRLGASSGMDEPPPLRILYKDETEGKATEGRWVVDQRVHLDHMPNGVFYVGVNNFLNATRGRSLLMPCFDWLDLYDSFCFGAAERALSTMDFVWDVQLNGMSPTQQKEWLHQNPMPAGRSMRVHNEQVIWQAIAPHLQAFDVSEQARMIRMQCMIALGIPEAWVFCHSSDTETLTDRGWLPYELINESDKIATVNQTTHEIEYQHFSNRWQFQYDGPMYHLRNLNYDALVTPGHQLWVSETRDMHRSTHRHQERQPYTFIEVQNLYPRHMQRWMRASAKTEGKEHLTFEVPHRQGLRWRRTYAPYIVRMDDWVEFLGWYISEGCARTTAKILGKQAPCFDCRISQKKPENVLIIRDLMNRLPYSYHEYVNKDTCTYSWEVRHRPLVLWLKEECGTLSEDKRLPKFMFNVSIRQKKIFLDALMAGDGHMHTDGHRGGRYHTTSESLANDLQWLAISMGYACKIDYRPHIGPRSHLPQYHIQWWQADELPFDRDAWRQESYSGWVYCFTVPNHVFITRRNGRVMISGNSGADTNRSTLSNQAMPTLKYLSRLQREAKALMQKLLEFVRDQAILAKKLPSNMSPEDEEITVEGSEVSTVDLSQMALTLKDATAAVMVGEDREYFTHEEAATVARRIANEFGTDLASEVPPKRLPATQLVDQGLPPEAIEAMAQSARISNGARQLRREVVGAGAKSNGTDRDR